MLHLHIFCLQVRFLRKSDVLFHSPKNIVLWHKSGVVFKAVNTIHLIRQMKSTLFSICAYNIHTAVSNTESPVLHFDMEISQTFTSGSVLTPIVLKNLQTWITMRCFHISSCILELHGIFCQVL